MGWFRRWRVRGVVAVRAYGAGDWGARGVRPGDGRAGSRSIADAVDRARDRARAVGRRGDRSIGDWGRACRRVRACVCVWCSRD